MIFLLLAQLAIPLALAAWMLLRPARSAVGLAAQGAGSLLALAALARVGLWLFPPWWTPHAAAGIVVLAAVVHSRGRRWTAVRPAGGSGWMGLALSVGLGAAGAVGFAKARGAARPPEEPTAVELAFPLAAGRYLVANGGAWRMINAHRASLDPTIVRLRPWRGNGHGVDLIATHASGLRARGVLPAEPSAYAIFGTEVLAPCRGGVVEAVDGLPDMRVPEYDRANMAGNHVILECAAGVHVVLAHLQRGTLRVRPGDRVEPGMVLGAVGNSGGTSEPHLHVHAQRPGPPGAPMGGDPLPMRLGGRYLVRGDRVRVPRRRRRVSARAGGRSTRRRGPPARG